MNGRGFLIVFCLTGLGLIQPGILCAGQNEKTSNSDVNALMSDYRRLVEANRSSEAVALLENVVQTDPKHYEALSYLASYHYLQGKKLLDETDAGYWALDEPTRMQTAAYQEKLKDIYGKYFKIAEEYLIRAYLLRRNDHLDRMAAEIASLKDRIGLSAPGFKKRPAIIQKLLP